MAASAHSPKQLSPDRAILRAEYILKAPSYGFLGQIAKAESDMGNHPDTYSGKADCGVWQLTPVALADTQDRIAHPNLKVFHARIYHYTGIDWNTLECEDMNNNLLGALAARMYLLNIPEEIPGSIKERAWYWKEYYNTKKGSGTVDHFIRANNE
jgi:hypothetical protein